MFCYINSYYIGHISTIFSRITQLTEINIAVAMLLQMFWPFSSMVTNAVITAFLMFVIDCTRAIESNCVSILIASYQTFLKSPNGINYQMVRESIMRMGKNARWQIFSSNTYSYNRVYKCYKQRDAICYVRKMLWNHQQKFRAKWKKS